MNTSRPTILMYHAVERVEADPNRLCVSPETFDAQMSYLRRRGLRGVAVAELLRVRDVGAERGLVGLTFDDAYRSFLSEAVPVLERHGFSATVFAVAERLGGQNDWAHSFEPRPPMSLMTADELREASERGMEVGSHTMTHAWLPGLEPEALEREVVESRRRLEEILGEELGGFCYPYGAVDAPSLRAARRAGYDYACAWKTRIEHDDYDLFRTPIDETDGLMRFRMKLRIYPQYATVTRVLTRVLRSFRWGHA